MGQGWGSFENMNLVRIKAICKKEFIQIRREAVSLAIVILMPVVQLIIYGYALTFDVNNLTTVVHDQDKSRLSRELVAEFERSGYFTVTAYVENGDALDYAIDSGQAQIGVTIPANFARDIERRRAAQVGIVIDGSNSNTASIASGYISAISQLFPQRLAGIRLTPLIDARPRVWYNTDLRSKNFLIPGLIAIIMATVLALLTSMTIAREWERGTMEQLISTPVKPIEVIIGKIIPYFIIGLFDMVLSVAMGLFLFDVPMKGSFGLLFVLSCIFLFGGVCQGIVISINAKGSQATASQISLLITFLPSMLLSGFIFAIANMPRPLQFATYILPARYVVSILKGIFMKGSTLGLLWHETALLSVFGVVMFLMAVRRFQRRVE